MEQKMYQYAEFDTDIVSCWTDDMSLITEEIDQRYDGKHSMTECPKICHIEIRDDDYKVVKTIHKVLEPYSTICEGGIDDKHSWKGRQKVFSYAKIPTIKQECEYCDMTRYVQTDTCYVCDEKIKTWYY